VSAPFFLHCPANVQHRQVCDSTPPLLVRARVQRPCAHAAEVPACATIRQARLPTTIPARSSFSTRHDRLAAAACANFSPIPPFPNFSLTLPRFALPLLFPL